MLKVKDMDEFNVLNNLPCNCTMILIKYVLYKILY